MSHRQKSQLELARTLRASPPTRISKNFETLSSSAKRALESLEFISKGYVHNSEHVLTQYATSIWAWIEYFLQVAAAVVDQPPTESASLEKLDSSLHNIYKSMLTLLNAPDNLLPHLKRVFSPDPYAPIIAALWRYSLTSDNEDLFVAAGELLPILNAHLGSVFLGAFGVALPSDAVPICMSRLSERISTENECDIIKNLTYLDGILGGIGFITFSDLKHSHIINHPLVFPRILSVLRYLVKLKNLSDEGQRLVSECIRHCLFFLSLLMRLRSAFAFAQVSRLGLLPLLLRAFCIVVRDTAQWFTWSPRIQSIPVNLLNGLIKYSIHRSVARGIVKGVEDVLMYGIDIPREGGVLEQWLKLKEMVTSKLFSRREKVFRAALKKLNVCENKKCPLEGHESLPYLCSRCKIVCYCSRLCQKEDYPSHKSPCLKFAEELQDETKHNYAMSTVERIYIQANMENYDLDRDLMLYMAVHPHTSAFYQHDQLTVDMDFHITPPKVTVRRREESDLDDSGSAICRVDEHWKGAPLIMRGIVPISDEFGQCIVGPFRLAKDPEGRWSFF